jgi:hypothetical protein
MRTPILIHPARREQIRSLAQARGVSIAEAIEYLLLKEIEAGGMPDTLPGFASHAVDGRVVVTISGAVLPGIGSSQAGSLAQHFEQMADPQHPGTARQIQLTAEFALTVGRHGRGVVISLTDGATGNETRASMTHGMARDFARIIRKASIELTGAPKDQMSR